MYSILTEYAIDLEIKAFFSSLVAFLSFKMLRPPFNPQIILVIRYIAEKLLKVITSILLLVINRLYYLSF
jgi:hypothetical protein